MMKERESMSNESKGSQVERGKWHVVYTERHGAIRVKYPPGLSKERVIRITVGELPGGEMIVNLYTEADYGYAYNVTCPAFSEWGYLPE